VTHPLRGEVGAGQSTFFKASQNIKIAGLCGVATAKCRSKSLKFKKGEIFEERGSSLSSSKENLERKE
jgi:hypothetical protein